MINDVQINLLCSMRFALIRGRMVKGNSISLICIECSRAFLFACVQIFASLLKLNGFGHDLRKKEKIP